MTVENTTGLEIVSTDEPVFGARFGGYENTAQNFRRLCSVDIPDELASDLGITSLAELLDFTDTNYDYIRSEKVPGIDVVSYGNWQLYAVTGEDDNNEAVQLQLNDQEWSAEDSWRNFLPEGHLLTVEVENIAHGGYTSLKNIPDSDYEGQYILAEQFEPYADFCANDQKEWGIYDVAQAKQLLMAEKSDNLLVVDIEPRLGRFPDGRQLLDNSYRPQMQI